jgi:hypothetical protein
MSTSVLMDWDVILFEAALLGFIVLIVAMLLRWK